MKADLVRIALIPYFVLLLVICNWNVKLYAAVTLNSFYFLEYILFIFCGLATARLMDISPGTYAQKSARIIIIVNLVVLLGLFLLGILQIFVFFDVRYFYQISFLLFGYYLYLLVISLRKGETL
ncbi:hypothetical protein DW091_03345 [Eubacterium sp. AM05-23]|uniref:hypothetical protein n=1 Tax=Eubacterium TaxID=1730 RepID=UPI000E55676E|nr:MULTISPECIES: hypothetical protein [Eubacterium]RHO60517.1 hypothetical protein DW091_03345 [Eubacterium sp. AM05-23]